MVSEFQKNPNPNTNEILVYSEKFTVEVSRVTNWFRNRRNNFKKKATEKKNPSEV
jgi:hypothetical protein